MVLSYLSFSYLLECTPNVDVPVTHNAKRGETIQHQCQRGFLEVTCNMTGTWDVDGIEDDGCCKFLCL